MDIKLRNAKDVADFLDTVSHFDEDVNLHIDSQIIDAKSLIILMNVIDLNRHLQVEIVTNSDERRNVFEHEMEKFEL